jgi:DNA polymerase-3 subunit delta'
MNIHEILMKKATKNELAHFYILESSAPEEESYEHLMKFTHNFIRDYYQKIEGAKQSMANLMDHPDVYVMGNHPDYADKKDPNYIVEEAEAMIRFFEFSPLQGKRKFAVIPEGHKVTERVANKWLKLLEEPNGSSTIFLLNPRRHKLLDTIHSRAQHLRLSTSIPAVSLEEWKRFLSNSKTQSLAQFIEQNSKQNHDVFFWTNEMIRWETEQFEKIDSKIALAEWLKKLKEMEIFHQPSATKWTLFYSYLQTHVLPRF